MRVADDGRGFGNRRLEAEGASHELQIVVDGLGNAHDRYLQLALEALLGDVARSPE